MVWGLNLPGTPRATSACRGTPLPLPQFPELRHEMGFNCLDIRFEGGAVNVIMTTGQQKLVYFNN